MGTLHHELLNPASAEELRACYGPDVAQLDLGPEAASRLAVLLFDVQRAVEERFAKARNGWENLWEVIMMEVLRRAAPHRPTTSHMQALKASRSDALHALNSIDVHSCLFLTTARAVPELASAVGKSNVLVWTHGSGPHQKAKVENAGVWSLLGRQPNKGDVLGGHKLLALSHLRRSGKPIVCIDDSPSIHEKVSEWTGRRNYPVLTLRVQTGHQRLVHSEPLGGDEHLVDRAQEVPFQEFPDLLWAVEVVRHLASFNEDVRVYLDCDGTLWDNARMRLLQAEALLPFVTRALRT